MQTPHSTVKEHSEPVEFTGVSCCLLQQHFIFGSLGDGGSHHSKIVALTCSLNPARRISTDDLRHLKQVVMGRPGTSNPCDIYTVNCHTKEHPVNIRLPVEFPQAVTGWPVPPATEKITDKFLRGSRLPSISFTSSILIKKRAT